MPQALNNHAPRFIKITATPTHGFVRRSPKLSRDPNSNVIKLSDESAGVEVADASAPHRVQPGLEQSAAMRSR